MTPIDYSDDCGPKPVTVKVQPKDMQHYCEGKWIQGTPGLCPRGLTRGMHIILLAKPMPKDDR